LGYTFLYAFEIIESMEINLEIPSLVHMVMAEAGHIKDCVNWGIPGKEKKLSLGDIQQGGKAVRWEIENRKTGEVMVLSDSEWKEQGWSIEDPEIQQTYEIVPFGFTRMYGQVFSDKPGKLDKSSPHYEPHENWRCVKSEGFEEGLPIWKIFSWHFWESPAHPVGKKRLGGVCDMCADVLVNLSSLDINSRLPRKIMRDILADKERRTTSISVSIPNIVRDWRTGG
jgi:hypothetical protein